MAPFQSFPFPSGSACPALNGIRVGHVLLIQAVSAAWTHFLSNLQTLPLIPLTSVNGHHSFSCLPSHPSPLTPPLSTPPLPPLPLAPLPYHPSPHIPPLPLPLAPFNAAYLPRDKESWHSTDEGDLGLHIDGSRRGCGEVGMKQHSNMHRVLNGSTDALLMCQF